MKAQIIVETATKSFKSKIQNHLDQESIDQLKEVFEKIKEFNYFKIESEDGITYYFHPNQIVALGIRVIEN